VLPWRHVSVRLPRVMYGARLDRGLRFPYQYFGINPYHWPSFGSMPRNHSHAIISVVTAIFAPTRWQIKGGRILCQNIGSPLFWRGISSRKHSLLVHMYRTSPRAPKLAKPPACAPRPTQRPPRYICSQTKQVQVTMPPEVVTY
jgi:hypothetical protein